MKFLVSFFIYLAISLQVLAQVPENSPSKPIYLRLMEDFYSEMRTMDAVKESVDLREQVIQKMRKALAGRKPNEFVFEKGHSWSSAWPTQKSLHVASRKTSFEKFQAAQASVPGSLHSIQDLSGYIGARVGSESAALIRQGKVQALVLGGSERSLPAFLGVPESQIYKLPSLYESWGLSRYFVPAEHSPNKVARLIYVVPPSSEYLDHYHLMLSELRPGSAQVYRSEADYQDWKKNLAQGVRSLGTDMGGRFDYVALGYYNQWREVLLKNYNILESQERTLESGHMGRYYLVQSKLNGTKIRLLTLGHQKTIWGEASAHLIEGSFDFNPRGVIFMGSAGAISDQIRVYDISAPQAFRTKLDQIDIQNFIRPSATVDGGAGADPIQVHFESVHGNTSSPAAQTISYLEKHLSRGEDTIDVEQSLIAEVVAKYNKAHSRPIQFGAVNLITDKPLGHAEYDLDRVDPHKKSRARLASVALALQAIAQEVSRTRKCHAAHR